MFQVQDRATREAMTVFAVHKSGPHDDQTKFLVHLRGQWRWLWATQFEPLAKERPSAQLRMRGLAPAQVA